MRGLNDWMWMCHTFRGQWSRDVFELQLNDEFAESQTALQSIVKMFLPTQLTAPLLNYLLIWIFFFPFKPFLHILNQSIQLYSMEKVRMLWLIWDQVHTYMNTTVCFKENVIIDSDYWSEKYQYSMYVDFFMYSSTINTGNSFASFCMILEKKKTRWFCVPMIILASRYRFKKTTTQVCIPIPPQRCLDVT